MAVAAGASYLGVVFAGGPRLVDLPQARRVVAVAGTIPVFGVFGSQSPEEVLRVRDQTGLRGAQLHGPHTTEAAARLRAEGLIVWRVVRLADQADLDRIPPAVVAADAVLVEPLVTRALGGTGASLPLELARAARARLGNRRMVLAGGLTPERVARAIALIQPDVVDVSSGVEFSPGVKDPTRITRFVEAVVGHHLTS